MIRILKTPLWANLGLGSNSIPNDMGLGPALNSSWACREESKFNIPYVPIVFVRQKYLLYRP